MKKSIRFRITFIFIAITAMLIFAMFFANQFLFAKFYMNEKIGVLEDAYEMLDDVFVHAQESGITFDQIPSDDVAGQDTQTQSLFRQYFGGSNIDIVILNTETGETINASREGKWMVKKLETYLEFADAISGGQIPDSKYTEIKKTEHYTIQLNFDPRSNTSNLECWGTFTDERISFLLSMPVMIVEETTRLINRFILIVGTIVLLIGSVIIYITTSKLTKPVDDLARISKKMAEQDFTERYTGKNQDEIGVLGQSMNVMSEKLESAISELKETNAKLVQTNEQLEAANRKLEAANRQLQEDIDLKEKIDIMRKDFISNVSHELKTPISLIEGYAEGLTEGLAEDPDSRDYYCNVIIDEAGKMNHLVKQLTSLTQYEFGAAELTKECFDLTELIRNVVEKEKLRLEEAGARVQLQLPESAPVLADEFKIEEVFTNYLNNALNHLEGEKRIIIDVSSPEEGKVRLSVYNDGQPIPDDSIDRLWEKFYKVDKARTREYGGSGIGLSIVKAIMDAHGGKCGVINHETGVEFYAVLDGKQQE